MQHNIRPCRAFLALCCALAPCSSAQESELATLQSQAEHGDPAAQTALAWHYYRGDKLPEDLAAAARWFQKAAEQGNPEAQYMLGEMYSVQDGGLPHDPAAALDCYRKAAEQGHAQALLHLGWMYDTGKGVPEDKAQAAAWYRRAAESGIPEGQYKYAIMCFQGKGLPEDKTECLRWMLKAADQGYPEAQIMAAWQYHRGLGTEKDLVAAYFWCSLAEHGVEGGSDMLQRIAAEMTPEQIAAAQERARAWKPATQPHSTPAIRAE